jgi:ankyrin repeat protein
MTVFLIGATRGSRMQLSCRSQTPVALFVWLLLACSVVSGSDKTDLVDAVKKRDTKAVRELLADNVNVNVRQPDGATALHWAAHWSDLDLAELLIRRGAEVNATNDLGVTPLSLACVNGDASLVRGLLQAGADPNIARPTGETPLMTCARAGSPAAVELLLAHGATVDAKEPLQGQTALMWAAAEDHWEVVDKLVASGADVHAHTTLGAFTPLLFAAREGAANAVRTLLTNGANVNQTTSDGMSPLLLATVRGHWELAPVFLKHGADPNANAAGYTALHWAAGAWESDLSGILGSESYRRLAALGPGKSELVRVLVMHGADPNARMTEVPPRFGFTFGGSRLELAGATPFLLAAHAAQPEIMRLLADCGADPLRETNDQTTPLMAAAGLGHIDAFSWADESAAVEAVKLALKLGGDVKVANNAGNTALHGAAYAGWNSLVEMLVSHGAEINPKNERGWTPLTITEGFMDRSTGSNPRYRPQTAALIRKLGGTSDARAVP